MNPREGEPSTGEVIMEAAKSFFPMLEKMQPVPQAIQQPAPLQQRIPQPVQNLPQTVQAALQQPENPTDMQSLETMRLRMGLQVLNQYAAHDADPETYANLVLDTLTPDQVERLLSGDDWFKRLCEVFPPAAPYGGWYEELKEVILSIQHEALTPESETGSVGENDLPNSPVNAP
jgi:hypothetical protein